MALILTEKQNIAEFIYKTLQKHFENKYVNLRVRVTVVADLEKWRTEVKEIWNQKENEKFYSVYFDSEFICRVGSATSPKRLEVEFLKGVLEAYENNRIFFNLADYKEETELLKQVTHDKKEDKRNKKLKIDKLNVNPIVKETLKQLEDEKDETYTAK